MPKNPRIEVRINNETDERLDQLAVELQLERADIVRSLVTPVLRVATPLEEQMCQMVRQLAERKFGQVVAA